jgi:hypothetical protein
MADYAAAPSQPILQGLITIVAGAPVFTGKGIATIFRTPATATPAPVGAVGDFTLVLEPGLPGDAGVDPAFARTMITTRGAGASGAATIDEKSILYATVQGVLPPVSPPLPGIGANAIRVILEAGGAPEDPSPPAAGGVEIIVWRGWARDPNFQVQIIGPLFQPTQVL